MHMFLMSWKICVGPAQIADCKLTPQFHNIHQTSYRNRYPEPVYSATMVDTSTLWRDRSEDVYPPVIVCLEKIVGNIAGLDHCKHTEQLLESL